MARILTPDEVNALPTMGLHWMEFRLKRGDDLLRMYLLAGHKAKARMRKYGITWRVWSDRPTEEQRRAVKWDG